MYIFLQVLQPLIPIHTFFIFLFCFAPAKSRLRLVICVKRNSERSSILFPFALRRMFRCHIVAAVWQHAVSRQRARAAATHWHSTATHSPPNMSITHKRTCHQIWHIGQVAASYLLIWAATTSIARHSSLSSCHKKCLLYFDGFLIDGFIDFACVCNACHYTSECTALLLCQCRWHIAASDEKRQHRWRRHIPKWTLTPARVVFNIFLQQILHIPCSRWGSLAPEAPTAMPCALPALCLIILQDFRFAVAAI